MPSVEYNLSTLVWGTETREYTDPDTGETTTYTEQVEQRPFEVRISKWLERDGVYHVYGYVEAPEFGQQLASQSDPYGWVTTNYQTADGVTETIVGEMVEGVGAIEQSQLGAVLSAGGVTPTFTEVRDDQQYRMDFTVGLNGATVFDIDWLAVDFDPTRGG